MDHTPEPDISNSSVTYGPCIALGPFTESKHDIIDLIQENHVPRNLSVCQDRNNHRWIIGDPTNYRWIIDELKYPYDTYYAVGPFVSKQHRTVMDASWVTCIVLEHGQLVNTNGFGVVCDDRNRSAIFWVVCIPFGCLPVPKDPRILIDTTLTHIATDSGSGQAHDEYPSAILEAPVEGGRDPSGMERSQTEDYGNVDTAGGGGEVATIPGNGPGSVQAHDEYPSAIVEARAEPLSHGTVQTEDYTQPGNVDTTGGDGVVATIPGYDYGLVQAHEYPLVIQAELADWDRKGFGMARYVEDKYNQLRNVDTTGSDDGSHGEDSGFQFRAVEGSVEVPAWNGDEILDLQTSDGEAGGFPDMLLSNVGEGAVIRDEILNLQTDDGDDGGLEDMLRSTVGEGFAEGAVIGYKILNLQTGDGDDGVSEDMLFSTVGEGIQYSGIAEGAVIGDEILNLQTDDGDDGGSEDMLRSTFGEGFAEGAVIGDEILNLQPGDGGVETANEDDVLNLQPGDGGGGAVNGAQIPDLQPGEQGLSTEDQNVQVQGQPAVTKSSKKKRKRAREPTMKNHGVKKRQGGAKTTYVAYFRPSALPESDKRFVTVGEFESEDDAWSAFNLFSMVHEGVPSYKEITSEETKLDLDLDASFWREFHHVALLAHLRLKGRGELDGAPRYRNVKRRASKGGNVVYSCDVILPKGMTDPEATEGMKNIRTFDSSLKAAKAADKLMYLKEGMMAWTNFALTDYMTKEEIKQRLPCNWIPLQDNPKKYLTNDK